MNAMGQRRKIERDEIRRAMQAVPRQAFVPPEKQRRARADWPVAIGFGQTISQPSLVARMLELLDLNRGDKVLEIGTGSGYQTALLAELGTRVYSLEIITPLAEQAVERLRALGYTQVALKVGDGSFGWPEHAPYDAIVVAAAARRVPPPLVEQLADEGRLLIPVGPRFWGQVLRKYVKHGQRLVGSMKGWVAFVPFTGGASRND
jgi:protein-L-isoaspartate(D-aspartate) O-methyltransferase